MFIYAKIGNSKYDGMAGGHFKYLSIRIDILYSTLG